MSLPFELMPAAASTTSDAVDLVALLVFAIIGLVSLGVIVAMVWIVVRDRRRPGNLTGRGHHTATIWRTEFLFCGLTGAVFLGLFTLGAVVFDGLARVPADADALDVSVTAKRWMWSFQHPGGRRELSQLHVPAGRAVRLHLASEDVIHSFYVPAFRLKQDVVPGWQRTAWFRATAPGTYALACAEYCGTEHALMRAEVVVMPPHVYDHWLAQGDDERPPLVAAGRALFERLDCGACHESHQRRRAPPLEGLYGRTVALRDGGSVLADDDYIRRSILRPDADIVADYQSGVMPTYAGLVDDDELLLLVAYVRSLAAAEGVSP
ncbi:cytochrome c oxidase subunit II [Nannocystis bainbridge]|uniref:Cupredoxin domain-containing protein n=1 Tax=Nannocystis bainbridge TaxID=2995303 RepID=A0ABT5E6N7_9BACT|nr:c-type cytochrome [Nannocystis bainbridge]MDC0721525.1 cupredoxin domain-containing protein [Nannocystis bainbridge]